MTDNFIEIEEFESNFAQVPKPALKDKNLSLKAKGLYAYLFSLPKDWRVYRTELLNHLSDGKDSLNSAFKELETFGYIQSTSVRENGMFKGYKLKLLINSIFDTNKVEPLRKNRNGETVNGSSGSGKSAPNNTDSNNTSLPNGNDNINDLFSCLPSDAKAETKKQKNAAKRKKGTETTFQDSPVFDVDILTLALSNPDYFTANVNYYHQAAETWSDKGHHQINWLATIKGFILRDIKAGTLVTKDKSGQKLRTIEDFTNNYHNI